MPFLKKARLNLPRSTVLDNKAKKSGLRGTIFAVNGDNYTGEWLDNKKHGWGTQEWKSTGSIYNGDWKFGKHDGYGIFSVLRPDTKKYATQYCGEWKNGMKHGHGSCFYMHATYEGEWSEDNRSGWGRLTYKCGDLYEGEWLWDKEDGTGVIQFAARCFRLLFPAAVCDVWAASQCLRFRTCAPLLRVPVDGCSKHLRAVGRRRSSGAAQEWETNGNWYEGSWKDGKKNGHGKFYYADKGLIYEGLWVDGDAKCGTLSDYGRETAPYPTKYPIPKVTLMDMQMVLAEAESVYVDES
ncbi:MORN repeat-containing protein 3-like [Vanacampus margaritifer]